MCCAVLSWAWIHFHWESTSIIIGYIFHHLEQIHQHVLELQTPMNTCTLMVHECDVKYVNKKYNRANTLIWSENIPYAKLYSPPILMYVLLVTAVLNIAYLCLMVEIEFHKMEVWLHSLKRSFVIRSYWEYLEFEWNGILIFF